MLTPTIYILLPVHNRCAATANFIDCLNSQNYGRFHLVLIDDGSTDGTAEMAREQVASVTVLRGLGDWWWAGSLQQGYHWLKTQKYDPADLVLIINDDTEFDADFLQAGRALLQNREHTMLQAWSLCKETGALLDTGVHADWGKLTFDQAVSVDQINCVSTNGLLMTAADFIATGGFRPGLLPHYASDYEFTIRAHRNGMTLLSDPSFRLRLDQASTGYHELYVGSLWRSVRRIFTRKSTRNPFMWSAFVLLSCPSRYKLLNLYRIWANLIFEMGRIARLSLADRGKRTR